MFTSMYRGASAHRTPVPILSTQHCVGNQLTLVNTSFSCKCVVTTKLKLIFKKILKRDFQVKNRFKIGNLETNCNQVLLIGASMKQLRLVL